MAKQFYLRIESGKFAGVWTVKPLPKIASYRKGIKCPQCGRCARAALDLIQWGFWDDHYTTYFVCRECAVAYQFDYDVRRKSVTIAHHEGVDK